MNHKESKLIVEFMGGKYVGTERMDGQDYHMYDLPESFPIKLSGPDEFGMKRTGYLGFDCSWDWIRPVIERIGDIAAFHNDDNSTDVYKKCGDVMSIHICCSLETVYRKIVKFIQWYNSLTPNPTT